jgi:hypothetical protein
LSWMSTLTTCTGWQVSCSLEFRSDCDKNDTTSEVLNSNSRWEMQYSPSPCLSAPSWP